MDYRPVLSFWFEEIDSALWWKKDTGFDQLICERFGSIHRQAIQCELYPWRSQALGRLAEIIVLDQFSRNIFRASPESFAYDGIALVLAQEAIAVGANQKLEPKQRAFLYMPFMHSESAAIHELAVKYFGESGMKNNLEFELKHKAIIDRFARYPHRNELLGRESTPEELEFLKESGSSF